MLNEHFRSITLTIRFLAALIVFIGSYLPLSLILLAQDFRYDLLGQPLCWPPVSPSCVIPFRNGFFPLIIFLACGICFLLSIIKLWSINPKIIINIQEIKPIPAELMSYTLPYVVSFMSLEYQETGKFIGLIIFLFWMFIITLRSGQIILNPALAVLGWNLYDVTYAFPGSMTKHSGKVLSKIALNPNQNYRHSTVSNILIIKNE